MLATQQKALLPSKTKQKAKPHFLNENALIAAALACLEKQWASTTVTIDSSDQVKSYLRLQLAAELNEVFGVLFLDQQHRVLAFEKLFQGTINETTVYPRVIVQRALHHNAASLILAHNHPSGTAEPSQADQHLTQQLQKILQLIDVKVLDHLVVTAAKVASFAELGLI